MRFSFERYRGGAAEILKDNVKEIRVLARNRVRFLFKEPYKFVSFKPGVELVLEAFDGYWRKTPSIKRLVLRSLPDETTRAAALNLKLKRP